MDAIYSLFIWLIKSIFNIFFILAIIIFFKTILDLILLFLAIEKAKIDNIKIKDVDYKTFYYNWLTSVFIITIYFLYS